MLVLRALGLGDTLAGIAALRGVRRAWPDHRLVLAAPSSLAGWLHRLGVVDGVVSTSSLAALDFPVAGQVAVNLHGRGPRSHQLLSATQPVELVGFRCPPVHESGPDWRRDEHEVLRWCRLVSWAGGQCGPEDLRLEPSGRRSDAVVVHPGAASPARRWPVARWRAVVSAIGSKGFHVLVTGSADEAELCTAVADASPLAEDRSGQLVVADLAELVGCARLLVCGDTGVAHLATAYATPSVLLFGPTSPGLWGPVLDPELHTVLWPVDDAASYVGDPHASVVDPVLERIRVAEVLAAANALLH